MAHTRRPLATISIHNNTNDLGPVDLSSKHKTSEAAFVLGYLVAKLKYF